MYKKPTIQDIARCAAFLEVSERTARRYLQAPASMPAPEAKLWALYCDGKLVPDTWHGVRFHGDKLATDTGYTLLYGQVQQFGWHMDCLDLLLRDLARVSAAVRQLETRGLRLATREREKLERLEQTEQQLQDGMPDLRGQRQLHRSHGC